MAMTKKQARELQAELAREYRRKVKERLKELRGELIAARRERKGAVARARQACKDGRASLRERVKLRRVEAMTALRDEVRRMKAEAREACGLGKRAPGERVRTARETCAAERKFWKEMRRIEGHQKARKAEIRSASAKERRGESDDEVRSNLPPDLVPLFERVKRSIKATDRMSRTEAFFQYAHENPREVVESIDDKTDRVIAELEARQAMGRRCMRSRETFAEVPF